jgi:hypothetical protein
MVKIIKLSKKVLLNNVGYYLNELEYFVMMKKLIRNEVFVK